MPFVKGKSGNPAGRAKVVEEFRDRARKAADEHVISAWISEVESMGDSWLKASELLAAYGYGRPTQGVELTGKDGKDLIPEEIPTAQLRALLAIELAKEKK
jgi:hypothetical protein